MLVDTHVHLCDPCYDDDRSAVLDRAEAAGVGAVVAVGETIADARRNLELAAEDPRVHPAAGLFPTRLDPDEATEIEELLRQHRDRFVAIGEVGLDHFKTRDHDQRAIQRDLFVRAIDLALELDLPLNVHSRATGKVTIDTLIERGARRVQLHAFDGKHSHALRAVEAGYFFSVPASIVRSQQKRKLVSKLPLDCLLVETDSPVLAPDRESRNEPANAVLSLREIAAIKEVNVEEVRERVIDNTRRLYGERVSSAGS